MNKNKNKNTHLVNHYNCPFVRLNFGMIILVMIVEASYFHIDQ
jgi:hypothetical protein